MARFKPEKRVTSADVAARAGVSVSTVSKALSGNGAVSRETRDRILAAAKQIGFIPRASTSSQKVRRTETIGVITSDNVGRLTVPVLLGATETLAADGYALLLLDGRGDPIREQQFIASLLKRDVDGILMTGAGEFSREPVRGDVPVPVVYAMAWSTNPADASVVPDDAEGARMATRHLLSTSRRHIVFISGPEKDDASRSRSAAVEDELQRNGLALASPPVFGEWSERWGRQAAAQFVKSGVEFDGVVCANDQIARGVTEALREQRIEVPSEVGVIGFDNWDVMVEASRPRLSTIDMSLREVGNIAARLLLDSIEEGHLEPGVRHVDCQLIIRESTAPF
ncbi:LacI family DNA-binding transcriptional regulator [Humibacter ginsengiterrae]